MKTGSETLTRRSPTIPFGIVTCTFSDNLSGNSCIQCSRSPRNTSSSRLLSARQIAQNQKLWKKFPTKNTSQYPWPGEEIRDWPGLKDLALSWWIDARFVDAGEVCELRLHTVTFLASFCVGKQHRTNNEPQNRIKGPWLNPSCIEKATTGPSLGKYNLFLYLCLYFFGLTTILNFSYKEFKSFVICKTVSKLVVIYAPSFGHLCLYHATM